MTPRPWLHAALAGASFSLWVATAVASPQVVGDDACVRHAVDIASFATCEGGKVVPPDAAPAPRTVRVALQVVGDEACERHAVDIEAFATCENNRVVRPAAVAIADLPLPPGAPLAVAQRR